MSMPAIKCAASYPATLPVNTCVQRNGRATDRSTPPPWSIRQQRDAAASALPASGNDSGNARCEGVLTDQQLPAMGHTTDGPATQSAASQPLSVTPFHVCDICGMQFGRKEHLVQHKITHTGSKPFECDVCHKTFRRKESLTIHRRIHTGEKPYACSECARRFSDSANLRRHMRTHQAAKPFKCSQCQRTFTQVTHLREHQRLHLVSQGDMDYFTCPVLGCTHRGFRSRSALSKHLKLHSNRKRFAGADHPAAATCAQSTVKASAPSESDKLTEATSTHDGPSRTPGLHRCPACGTSFRSKPALLLHRKAHERDGTANTHDRKRKAATHSLQPRALPGVTVASLPLLGQVQPMPAPGSSVHLTPPQMQLLTTNEAAHLSLLHHGDGMVTPSVTISPRSSAHATSTVAASLAQYDSSVGSAAAPPYQPYQHLIPTSSAAVCAVDQRVPAAGPDTMHDTRWMPPVPMVQPHVPPAPMAAATPGELPAAVMSGNHVHDGWESGNVLGTDEALLQHSVTPALDAQLPAPIFGGAPLAVADASLPSTEVNIAEPAPSLPLETMEAESPAPLPAAL